MGDKRDSEEVSDIIQTPLSMGNVTAKLYNSLSDLFRGYHKDARIIMLGLDSAGKTTVLYKYKLNETISTIPTIGFNVETVQINKINLTMWDVGGQNKIRPLWRHYYEGSNALIWVVDSADAERFEEAREELECTLKDLPSVPLLILANKCDLPRAHSASVLRDSLQLSSLTSSRKWFIQECCATRGEGLLEGMSWLCEQIN
jgi:small GTP-binding protein